MTRVAIIVIVCAILAACGGGGGGANVPHHTDVGSRIWSIFGSGKPPLRLHDLFGGGVAYDLRDTPEARAGYVVRRVDELDRGEIEIILRVEGDGVADPVNGDRVCAGQPAEIAVYFQRRGDDWLATEGSTEFYRWWWRDRIPLEPGTEVALTLPLEPSTQWTSVFAKSALERPDKFADAVEQMRYVGVTHGGCGAAGHGAYAKSGAVRVEIERLDIR